MVAMTRKESYDLANLMVPSMVHRGLAVDRLSEKLLRNPWLNVPDPIEIDLNIKKIGFNFEKQMSFYTKNDVEEHFDNFTNELKQFLLNNLEG